MKKKFLQTLIILGSFVLIHFASVSKSTVNYTLHGDGEKKVIVLHSWMDDYESWLPTIPHLDLKRHSYAFIDVRGYGKSINVGGTFTSDEIASDIFDVADDLGWKSFYLVGHSMTGMAVQKAVLLDKKNRIKKVIAITPVAAAGFPADEANMGFFKAIVQSEEVSNKAFRAFTSNRLSNAWYENRSKRHVKVTSEKAQLRYIDMWTGENFADQMNQVKAPFLVLAGQYDHPGFQLAVQKKAFSQFQNVELLQIENSGHFPMQETPVFLAAKIEEFIGRDD